MLRRPAPHVPVRGAVVHVPALGEEMNKSRHMVALQAQQLARDGWLVVQMDLLGTGDSAGDLADASWQAWLADVLAAVEFVRRQNVDTVWLWGVRLGALLAAEAVRTFGLECGLLLWQPVTSGKQHLQQFLRMWKAAQVLGKASDGAASPQQRLEAGETVEVAGYFLSPALAAGMQEANLSAVSCSPAVRWFQVGAPGMSEPPPAFLRLQHARKSAGQGGVSFHFVEGASFWQTQEISEVPALLEQTTRLMIADDALLVAP